MDEYRKKEIIKACTAILIIVLAIFFAVTVIYKYQVEGESEIPFKLSKITIVSTVEGQEVENSEEKWNLDIYQNNDVYFSIERNEDAKIEDIIQNVSIKNIKVTKNPEVGVIKTYMPNSSEGRLFNNSEDTIVLEKGLTYKGSTKSDSKTLEIGNQGGTAVIRFSNTELGNYASNDDDEVRHDATLLSKINLNEEKVKFAVSFDVVITLANSSYSSKVVLDLPCKDLEKNGTSSKEITDGLILKRINK